MLDGLGLRNPLEVVPLYSRLSAAEQHRVFQPHGGRRVVLATNVAETSLTVPGIRYVVDTGVARISRYSARTKVQRLPIEPISQASANQRSGRCGRVEAGIAIRLYSEEDFESRPEFTDPEILRTNLASVDPADDVARARRHRPLPVRRAARPAQRHAPACSCSRSSAPWPRRWLSSERRRNPATMVTASPASASGWPGCRSTRGWGGWSWRPSASAACATYSSSPRPSRCRTRASDRPSSRPRPTRPTPGSGTTTSDFLTWLNLWRYLREQQRELSSSAFRRMCKREFLNYLRVREWQSFESQLRQVCREMRIQVGHPSDQPDADGIHQALLSGLLSHIGLLEERDPGQSAGPREYLGARGARFAIFPGSGLHRKNPQFLMAARAGRDRPALGPPERRDQARVGRARSAPTWSSAPTPSRTGRRSGPP